MAFTVAEVKETDLTLRQLAEQEAKTRRLEDTLDEDDIVDWVTHMGETMDAFEIGDQVVYIDGAYWTTDAESVEFEGYFASHEFKKLPHAEALASDPDLLEKVLGQPSYWFDRELPDRE
jgi:hypothetical protein